MTERFNNRFSSTGSCAAAAKGFASARASFASLRIDDTVFAVSFFVALILALLAAVSVSLLGLILVSVIPAALIILAVLLITPPRDARSKPTPVRI